MTGAWLRARLATVSNLSRREIGQEKCLAKAERSLMEVSNGSRCFESTDVWNRLEERLPIKLVISSFKADSQG